MRPTIKYLNNSTEENLQKLLNLENFHTKSRLLVPYNGCCRLDLPWLSLFSHFSRFILPLSTTVGLSTSAYFFYAFFATGFFAQLIPYSMPIITIHIEQFHFQIHFPEFWFHFPSCPNILSIFSMTLKSDAPAPCTLYGISSFASSFLTSSHSQPQNWLVLIQYPQRWRTIKPHSLINLLAQYELCWLNVFFCIAQTWTLQYSWFVLTTIQLQLTAHIHHRQKIPTARQ